MLSLLAEIYQQMPEKGDSDQPELIIFIDEAHLIFNEASKVLLEQIETIVKLIRSKGVGIYFITQNRKNQANIAILSNFLTALQRLKKTVLKKHCFINESAVIRYRIYPIIYKLICQVIENDFTILSKFGSEIVSLATISAIIILNYL